MAKVPAHVLKARKQGVPEGFDAWVDGMRTVTKNGTGGLQPVRDELDHIVSLGRTSLKNLSADKATKRQIEYYCNKYDLTPPKAKSGNKPATRAKATPKATEPDLKALIAQAIAEALGTGEVEGEDDEDDTEDAGIISRLRGRNRRQNQPEPEAEAEVDPYAPRDPAADATQGRLWKLNELGLLAIVDEDGDILAGGSGDPITNGEAHEVIRAFLNGES